VLEQLKLPRHSYEENHKICAKQVKVLQIEPNTTYRKYKKFALTSLVDHSVSESILDIYRIRTPIMAPEVSKNSVLCGQ
jgi:hypothetical protein